MISRFVFNTQRTSLIIGKCKCNVWVGGLELEWFVFEGLTYIFMSWYLFLFEIGILELVGGRCAKPTFVVKSCISWEGFWKTLNYNWFFFVLITSDLFWSMSSLVVRQKKKKESIKIASWRQNQRNTQIHTICSLKSLTSFSRIALSTKVIYVSFY